MAALEGIGRELLRTWRAQVGADVAGVCRGPARGCVARLGGGEGVHQHEGERHAVRRAHLQDLRAAERERAHTKSDEVNGATPPLQLAACGGALRYAP
eukprot:3189496-Pleurochrysis_carterae.AAC.2